MIGSAVERLPSLFYVLPFHEQADGLMTSTAARFPVSAFRGTSFAPATSPPTLM